MPPPDVARMIDQMFEIRDLRLLTALARHGHFGRAAADCGISQPAFSMRIRALEDRLGMAIVRRGNRYQGLTAEGQAIVDDARDILDGVRTMEERLRSSSGEISGSLTLATVPTAAAYAARLTGQLFKRHPAIKVRIETATSLEIQLWIDEGRVDAGISYGDGISSDILIVDHLYDEQYVLVCPAALAPRPTGQATWQEASKLPLALLEPGMLNRRILDGTFAEAGVIPRVVSETNTLTTTMVMAQDGLTATIIPASLVGIRGAPEGTVTLDLTEPVISKPMALISAVRAGSLPTIQALRTVAGAMDQ